MSRMGTRRRTLSGSSVVMPERRFEAAERFCADLVCIGSHGHSGLAAALMESVAQTVIAHSPRPVLVVRPPLP